MKFIPDCHRCLTDVEDLLGTGVYADALYEIIDKNYNYEKLTIGLFGGWGSGKSSIVKTLENKIISLEKNNKMHIFVYDAWKYTGDAFRRSFLLEIDKNMGKELPSTIKSDLKNLYIDKHEDVEHRVGISKSAWLNLVILLPLFFLLFLITDIDSTLKTFIAILSPFLVILTYFIKNSLYEYKISVSNSKFFSPEQFESLFKSIISDYVKKSKKNKIIIVIDNIDRCDKETAKEAIIAIKNFLESNNCIFIIPVDDCAIIKSLGLNKSDGEEFLRKIFNTTIRIKNYSSEDLFSFTKNIIKKFDLKFSDEVADIISYEFPKNPRRIIQILNNLISEYNIAIRQEEKNFIDKGSITKNLDFLAKIQVIREEWPNLYVRICSELNTLDIINQGIKEGKDYKELELTEEQYVYLSNTRLITVNNIESFLKLKDFEKDVNDNIIEFIRNFDSNRILDCVNKKEITIERLVQLIIKELDDKLNKKRLWKTSGFNLLNLIFLLSTNNDFSNEIIRNIRHLRKYFESNKLRDHISNFDAVKLLSFSVELSRNNEESLRNHILSNIKAYENADIQLLHEYIKQYSFDTKYLADIKAEASIHMFSNYDSYLQFKDVVSKDNLKSIVDELKLIEMINRLIDDHDYDDVNKCIECLKFLNSVVALSFEVKKVIVKVLLEYANKTSDLNLIVFYLRSLEGFLNFPDDNSNYTDTLNNVYSYLERTHNSVFSPLYNRRSRTDILLQVNIVILQLFAEMYSSSTNSQHPSYQKIDTYFNRSEEEELFELAAKKYLSFIDESDVYNWPFAQSVINRFNTIGNVDLLQKITPILKRMIQKTTSQNGLNKDQIDKIVEISVRFYSTSNELQKSESKFLIECLIENKISYPILLEKIEMISNGRELDEFIVFLNEIKDTKIREKIVSGRLSLIDNYSDMKSCVLSIRSLFKDANPYVRKALINKLVKVENQEYLDTIKLIVEEQKIFEDTSEGKSALEDIIDRLQSIICGNGSSKDKKFSLSQLSSIDRYPDSKIPIVKNCLDKFKDEDEQEVNEVVKQIRDRLRVRKVNNEQK